MADPSTGALAVRREPAAPTIVLNPMNFEEALKFSMSLVKSGLLPNSVDTPQKAIVIMLKGQELGLPPMLSLQEIRVIQGNPTLSARLMLALFKSRGGKVKEEEASDKRCCLVLTHPNGDKVTSTFTAEEAKRITYDSWEGPAGSRKKVTRNLAEKDNWRNYPSDMLYARAVSRGVRRCAPDIIGNLYTPDEMGAVVDAEGRVIDVPPEPDEAPPAIEASVPEVSVAPPEPPAAEPEPQPVAEAADEIL